MQDIMRRSPMEIILLIFSKHLLFTPSVSKWVSF